MRGGRPSENDMQHRRLRYIGLDVHRATIAVAIAEEEGSAHSYGTIPNEASSIRKLMSRLGGEDAQLHVAYEAGPTGYALHRQLTKLGISHTSGQTVTRSL